MLPTHNKNISKNIEDKEWLYLFYVIKKWTRNQIAHECNCSLDTVDARMKKFGIAARDTKYKKNRIFTEHDTEINRTSHLGLHHSPETIVKLSKTKMGNKNPMFGKHHSTTWIEWRKTMCGKNHPKYGKTACDKSGNYYHGQYFYHPDGRRIWLRSSYETKVANILTKVGIRWIYEMPIDLHNRIYHVDFYLYDYDIYFEIKGWWQGIAKENILSCFELYPKMNLRILYEYDIINLNKMIDNNKEIEFNKVGISLVDQVYFWEIPTCFT